MLLLYNRFHPIVQTLFLVGLISAVGLFIMWGIGDTWTALLITPVVLAGLHYYQRLPKRLQQFYVAFLVVVIITLGWRTLQIVIEVLNSYAPNDFKHFWLSARVAIQGDNFYDAAQLHQQVALIRPDYVSRYQYLLSDYFLNRLVDTGFWYPPISILVFLPLGLFDDLFTAWAVNYVFMLVIFLVSIWQLWKTFVPKTGSVGVVAVTVLILLLIHTRHTFYDSQTNFQLMIVLLLLWRTRNRPQAGIWLAVAVVIKPLMLPLIVFPLCRKHWRTLLNFGLTLVAVSLVGIALNGTATFFSYNPARLPSIVYYEEWNQGLLATILRLTNYVGGSGSPILNPLFLASVLALGLPTAWLAYRLPQEEADWALAVIVSFAILVYPATLFHYGFFLLIPIVFVWSKRDDFPGGKLGAISFITLAYTMLNFQQGFQVFIAFLFSWIGLTFAGFRRLYGETWPFPLSQHMAYLLRDIRSSLPFSGPASPIDIARETKDRWGH